MALEKFSLGALASMDGGRIATAFQQALDRLRYDCEDRPSIKGARKVQLSVSLTPVATDSGELESVDVDIQMNERLPKRSSKSFNMEAVAGGLLFNELSPDEVKQKTLDMVEGRKPSTVVDGKSQAAGTAAKEATANAG